MEIEIILKSLDVLFSLDKEEKINMYQYILGAIEDTSNDPHDRTMAVLNQVLSFLKERREQLEDSLTGEGPLPGYKKDKMSFRRVG